MESNAGYYGVKLFFVISGFLITGILLNLRDETVGTLNGRGLVHFYMRRALRIWPAYFLLLGAALVFDVQEIRSVAGWHLLFSSNILFSIRNDYVPWVTAALWSLSVEEQFYLVWPLLMLLPPKRALPWIAWGGIGLAVLYRFTMETLGHKGAALYFLPPAQLDALAAGALLAIAQERRWSLRWLPWAGAAAAVAIVGLRALDAPDWAIEAVTPPALAAIVCLASRGVGGVAGAVLDHPLLRYVGRISYGVYLYHLFVFAAVLSHPQTVAGLSNRGPMMFAVAGSLTLLVAASSWMLIEAPANRLKRFFPYRAAAPPNLADTASAGSRVS